MLDTIDNEMDFYSSIGIEEEWGYENDDSDPYAAEDARTLKEFGY